MPAETQPALPGALGAWSVLSLCALVLLALSHPPVSARGQDAPAVAPGSEGPKAQVELIVPRQTVRPGETIDVGVKFTMQPGWHIYWTNPGDSGEPPTFNWALPGGGAAGMLRGGEWQATPPQFPTPLRWEMSGGLVGYGYAGSVIFPATLTVPASATPGQAVEVTLATDYLICADVCLPESATASATLEVSPDPGEADATAEKAIEEAKAALPAEKSDVQVSREDAAYTFSVPVPQGAKNVDVFPDLPQGLAMEDATAEQEGTSAKVTLKVRTMTGATVEVEGFDVVVGYDTPQGRRGVKIRIPLPDPPAG